MTPLPTCPRMDPLLSVVCLLVDLAVYPAAMFPRLTFHPSPETHTTRQIHSVIAGLINTVHSEATGSLRGQCACMDDTHMHTHTHLRTL